MGGVKMNSFAKRLLLIFVLCSSAFGNYIWDNDKFSAHNTWDIGTDAVRGKSLYFVTIDGTSLTDGTATLTGGNWTGMGNITGADIDISAGTGDYSSSGTITSGNITILSATPILVFRDSDSLGAASVGYIEWRDSGGGRAGFLGNNSSGNDDLFWKNEQGGNIGIQTTGAGKFQIFANVELNNNSITGMGNITGSDVDIEAGTGDYNSTGTLTAEQLTSTDDITMQGHLLTLGDVSQAVDTVISILGSTNSMTATYDETFDNLILSSNFRVNGELTSLMTTFIQDDSINVLKVLHLDTGAGTDLSDFQVTLLESSRLSNNGTTINDNFDNVLITRGSNAALASSILNSQGSLLKLTTTKQEIAGGVVNESADGLEIALGAHNTGKAIIITGGHVIDTDGDILLNTNNKIIKFGATDTDMQISSDGTNGIIDVATSLRLGNITTNYTAIGATGDVTFAGSAELIIPSSTTLPGTTNVGSLYLDTDAGTNGTLYMYANGGWRAISVLP